MTLPARRTPLLVGLGLIILVIGSAALYWVLQPRPQATQLIYGSGRIEADEVRLSSEVPGRVLENRAIEGSSVTSGMLVVRIDPVDYELQADRAKAQRNAARLAAVQIDGQIALAAHHAMTAKTDLARYEELSRRGWVSAQRLDVQRNAYVAAAEQVGVFREQRAGATAQADAAQKTLALARSQIGKTRVYAPLTAAVLERLVEPGEVVAAGQPLAILANLSTVRLRIFISEADLGRIRLGSAARIRVDAFPGRDFTARVTRIDAQAQFTPRDVHMKDERSRTVYGVTLEAANPEGLLKPGMPADAWILWDPKAGWPAELRVPE